MRADGRRLRAGAAGGPEGLDTAGADAGRGAYAGLHVDKAAIPLRFTFLKLVTAGADAGRGERDAWLDARMVEVQRRYGDRGGDIQYTTRTSRFESWEVMERKGEGDRMR